MKKRNGFVSNSSSSSFVLLTTKENHEKAMEKLSEEERVVVGKVVEEKKLFGKDMIKGYVYDCEDCSTFLDLKMGYDEADEAYSFWNKYVSILSENPEDLFSHDEDM